MAAAECEQTKQNASSSSSSSSSTPDSQRPTRSLALADSPQLAANARSITEEGAVFCFRDRPSRGLPAHHRAQNLSVVDSLRHHPTRGPPQNEEEQRRGSASGTTGAARPGSPARPPTPTTPTQRNATQPARRAGQQRPKPKPKSQWSAASPSTFSTAQAPASPTANGTAPNPCAEVQGPTATTDGRCTACSGRSPMPAPRSTLPLPHAHL